jgi:predicted RNA-binding protein with PIN domain
MKKFIIIDGNNLIHKIPELKNLFNKNPESAQLGLYEKLRTRMFREDKMILVFDGYGNEKSGMIYSGKLTADEIIRRFIEENHEKNAISVVSSDNYITSLARACGCEVIKSESFIKEETAKKEKTQKSTDTGSGEKPEYATKKEIEEFKKLFS